MASHIENGLTGRLPNNAPVDDNFIGCKYIEIYVLLRWLCDGCRAAPD